MEKISSQEKLFLKKHLIQNAAYPFAIKKVQWRYIKNYIEKTQKAFFLIFTLLIFSTATDVLFIFLARAYAKKQFTTPTTPFVVGGLVLFALVVNYFYLRFEKKYVFQFINGLKLQWVKQYFSTPLQSRKTRSRGSLITKIAYQINLLQTGLKNTPLALMRLFFFILLILLSSFFIDKKLFVLILPFLPLVFSLFLLGYSISKFYLMREYTVSSAILKEITRMTEEETFLLSQEKQKYEFEKLNTYFDLDVFYRTRRELWFDFSSKIILIITIASGIFFSIYRNNITTFTSTLFTENFILSTGVLAIYFFRTAYLSFKAGLFFFPTRFGIAIGIPLTTSEITKQNTKTKQLLFRSNAYSYPFKKTYKKNQEYCLEAGKTSFFYATDSRQGVFLIHLLSGNLNEKEGAHWIVVSDKKRFSYNIWKTRTPSFMVANTTLQTSATLGEILSGKDRQLINDADIVNITNTLLPYTEFKFIFENPSSLKLEISTFLYSDLQRLFIHIAAGLLQKPNGIFIDTTTNQNALETIIPLLEKIKKELSDSSITVIGTQKSSNSLWNYIYEL